MPPLYDYECKLCGKAETVVASITQSDTLPTEEANDTCEQHEWVKVILGAPTLYRSGSWGPGKGHW